MRATLLFDYDGTLHESLKIYAPSFRRACLCLEEEGLARPGEFTDGEIASWLGYSSKEMWDLFMPGLPQELKDRCSRIIGDGMVRLVREGGASLYPGAPETLESLSGQGYRLVFLSNCKRSYMEAHREYFHLDQYFTSFYCTEDYQFIPKHEIFHTVREEHPGPYIVIGDRFQDMEIAIKHGLESVGCTYGYGKSAELCRASALAGRVSDIVQCVNNLFDRLSEQA